MDILFCSNLSIKEETFILGVCHLKELGKEVTWEEISNLLDISTATARKIGMKLRKLNILEVELQYDGFGGAIPSHLSINMNEVKKHIIKHQ